MISLLFVAVKSALLGRALFYSYKLFMMEFQYFLLEQAYTIASSS